LISYEIAKKQIDLRHNGTKSSGLFFYSQPLKLNQSRWRITKWCVHITKRITKSATFLVLPKKGIRKKIIACPATIGGDVRTMKIGVLTKR